MATTPNTTVITREPPLSAEVALEIVEAVSPSNNAATYSCMVNHVVARCSAGFVPGFAIWCAHTSLYLDLEEFDALVPTPDVTLRGQRGALGFAFQVYCAAVFDAMAGAVSKRFCTEPLCNSDRDCFSSSLDELKLDVKELEERISERISSCDELRPGELSDIVATVYQFLAPADLRHLLGEYYTPRWLANHALSLLPSTEGSLATAVYDPTVGSATFLSCFVERAMTRGCSSLSVAGSDINLVAIRASWLSLTYHRHEASRCGANIEIRLCWADPLLATPAPMPAGDLFRDQGSSGTTRSLLGGHLTYRSGEEALVDSIHLDWQCAESSMVELSDLAAKYAGDYEYLARSPRFDVCVGNPPWISWDSLSVQYRALVAPRFSGTTLMIHTGWRARVSAGKTDLSSLIVYSCADRFTRPGGGLAFVLPYSLFSSRHAARGFRCFSTSGGKSYALTELHDLSRVSLFADAVNRAAVAAFRAATTTEYPVRAVEWIQPTRRSPLLNGIDKLAEPLDKSESGSPLVLVDREERAKLASVCGSHYRARGGINTGGANSMLWVTVIEERDACCLVENIGNTRHSSTMVRQGLVEKEMVYPLLRGADVRRWSAAPSGHLILAYDPAHPKRAISVEELQRRWPNAHRFLAQFENELRTRKEYIRWGGAGPFYEVYRIGPYTFAPHRVMWQHTGFRGQMRAAVISNAQPLPVPDQKVILIATETAAEAHYVCAVLNSEPVAWILRRYLGIDASTHVMDYSGVERYRPECPEHAQLARLSIAAHDATSSGQDVSALENEMNKIVGAIRSSRSAAAS